LGDTRRVLHRLPEFLERREETVFICEGEKDVNRLFAEDLLATTNPHGGGKWRAEFNAFLADRDVVILPDNDEPGRRHALEVAAQLQGVARTVKLIEPPDLPPKGDVSDWLDQGGSRDALLRLVEDADPLTIAETTEEEDDAYEATPRGIVWNRPSRDGPVPVLLSNFAADIRADIALDDGAESRRHFEIHSVLLGREQSFLVPACRFGTLDWVSEHLGAQAIVYPGQGKREHLRCAVQVLSREVESRTVFAHTGWRDVAGDWVYLHGGGALGKDGPIAGVETPCNRCG